MTIEVYDDQKLVIGYVVGQDTLHALELIRQNFPNVGSINTQGVLPKNDKRLQMIAPNVYRWNWNFGSAS
jgi:hypothetical protein